MATVLALLTTLTLSLGFAPPASAQTTTCGAPDLGGRVEVWTAVLTVGPIIVGPRTVAYGYHSSYGGQLSDTSFVFDSRTTTVNYIQATEALELRFSLDVEFDPDTDQEFIDVEGLPTLQSLRLHYCDTALDVSAGSPLTDGTVWAVGSGWSAFNTIVVTLSAPANSPAAGHPSIEGAPQFRSTMTAGPGNITDANGLANTVYSYQWVREDGGEETEISNAVGATYTTVSEDIGKSIKVTASFVDDNGYRESRTSNPTESVTALTCSKPSLGNRIEVWTAVLTVGPIIVGPRTVAYGYHSSYGGQLSDTSFVFDSRTTTVNYIQATEALELRFSLDVEFDPDTDQEFIDVEGLPTLQSLRLHYCDTALDVSAGSPLTDGTVWAVGSGWRSATTIEVALSALRPNNLATGTPTITGTPKVGQTLTASTADISDDDGKPSVFEYQWVRVDGSNRTNIGADQRTYTVRDADAGSQIQVEVTFTDDAGTEEGPLRSARTDVVTTVNAPPAPAKPRLYASSMQSGSTTELEVQWRPPLHAVPNPPSVDSYDVRYRVVGSQGWTNGPQAVTVTRAALTGLTAGTRYEVQVRSTSNVDGNSVWSRSAKGRTRTAGQAHSGDVRIVDGNAAAEGRLEILHAGVWGSVCDDRFSDPGGTPANHPGGTDRPLNVAPALACQMMGYTDGEYASGYGRNLVTSRQNPIWLDDVRCEPGSTHWTGSPATRLDQCNHAGWGVNNCTHEEDAGVRCFGSSSAQAPLTSEFQDVPESHDGTEFTFQVAFSEAVTASAEDLRDHAFEVTGASITEVTAVDGRHDLWAVTVAPTPNEDVTIELEAERACDVAGAICTEDGERLANTVSVEIAAAQPPPVELTARLDATPASHDGETAFTFRLSLSDDIANSDADVRDNAFEVSGGNVTDASRVDGRSDLWEITITPDGTGNVTIVLGANRPCTTAGALCTADGRTLTTPLLVSIATLRDDDDTGGPEPGAPLTARFVDMPAEHDGRKGFGFQLVFSEEVFDGTEQLDKNKAVRNALNITGGSAKGSRRVNASQFDAYWIRVRPSGNGPVTIRLAPPGTCTDSSPTCTPDGRKLSGPISATIEGPPGISITDATVEEAQGAVLEFGIALSRASSHQVTVDYATSDGTAQAGADYTATSGTVTFAAGEIKKTIDVTVLDDAHDEGSETLTLLLSNPSGAYLADGEATGTIENTDHMPQAWLSRFGRTVAEQVLDAVEERIRSAPQAGVQVTVAGQRIGAAQAPETEALEEAEAQARLEDFSTWLRGEAEARESRTGSRPVAPRELLTGSSFALTTGAEGIGGGLVSLWGRGAVSSFDGREGDLSLSGEVTGALLGADWTRERWTTGPDAVATPAARAATGGRTAARSPRR